MKHQLTAPNASLQAHLDFESDAAAAWWCRSIGTRDIAAIVDPQKRAELRHRKSSGRDGPYMPHPEHHRLALEPEVTGFAETHPEYRVVSTTGYWLSDNTERSWQRCRSHRVLVPADPDSAASPACVVATLTIRTTHDPWDGSSWGPDGSDLIPSAHRDRHMWLLDTLGVEYGYLIAYNQLEAQTRTYRIGRNEARINHLRRSAASFLESVRKDREAAFSAHRQRTAPSFGATPRPAVSSGLRATVDSSSQVKCEAA